MNKEERELFDYVMNPQGIKVGILAAKIHAVKQSGMRGAAAILRIKWNNLDGKGDELYNEAMKAILAEAEKPL